MPSVLGDEHTRIWIQLTSSVAAELQTQLSSTRCMHFSKEEDMEPPSTSIRLQKALKMNCTMSTTREVGRGTTYVIRSFREPDNDIRLCCEVIFDTQTTAPIKLEDNLALFILQSYENTDLDDNRAGSVTCCKEYHKFDRKSNKKMISIGATQITAARILLGMTAGSGGPAHFQEQQLDSICDADVFHPSRSSIPLKSLKSPACIKPWYCTQKSTAMSSVLHLRWMGSF